MVMSITTKYVGQKQNNSYGGCGAKQDDDESIYIAENGGKGRRRV